jgi:hypothetical protein
LEAKRVEADRVEAERLNETAAITHFLHSSCERNPAFRESTAALLAKFVDESGRTLEAHDFATVLLRCGIAKKKARIPAIGSGSYQCFIGIRLLADSAVAG